MSDIIMLNTEVAEIDFEVVDTPEGPIVEYWPIDIDGNACTGSPVVTSWGEITNEGSETLALLLCILAGAKYVGRDVHLAEGVQESVDNTPSYCRPELPPYWRVYV